MDTSNHQQQHGMPYSQTPMLQNQSSPSNCNNGGNPPQSYPFARGPPQHQIFRQHPNQLQPQQTQPLPSSSSSLYATNGNATHGTILTHQPQVHHLPSTANSSTPQYQPEVISIQVKGGRRKSLENISAQEPIYGTSSFLPPQQTNNNSNSQWQRTNGKIMFVKMIL